MHTPYTHTNIYIEQCENKGSEKEPETPHVLIEMNSNACR